MSITNIKPAASATSECVMCFECRSILEYEPVDAVPTTRQRGSRRGAGENIQYILCGCGHRIVVRCSSWLPRS